MLKAVFFRKRTAATYKGRNTSVFSDVNDRKLAIYSFQDWAPEDSVQATPGREYAIFAESKNQTEVEKRLEINNDKKDESIIILTEKPMEADRLISQNNNIQCLSQSDLPSKTNTANKRARIVQADTNKPKSLAKKVLSEQLKSKKDDIVEKNMFDIFDFPDFETDGAVELLKPQPTSSSRKASSGTAWNTAITIQNTDVMKNPRAEKRITRLRAEKVTYTSSEDEETSSQLSDELENYLDLPMEVLASTKLSASQNVDSREAELSAFMLEELGEGSRDTSTVHKTTKIPKQRKQYVSENQIKARFTYGSTKRQSDRLLVDTRTTESNSKSTSEVPERAETIPNYTATNNAGNCFMPTLSKDGSMAATQAKFSSSTENDISLLVRCLSELQTITFDFSKPYQAQEIQRRPNVVAAQTLIAYQTEPLNRASESKICLNIEHLVMLIRDNIEWCMDPFHSITMSESANMGKYVLLGHALNCYTILENTVNSGYKLNDLGGISDLVQRTLYTCQEHISEDEGQLSDVAYSCILCILRLLVNITHNSPSICSSMEQQLAVLHEIASSSYQKTASNGRDNMHTEAVTVRHELHSDITVLSLGVLINIFDGDIGAVAKFTSLTLIETCAGFDPCARSCTCRHECLTSSWIYEALIAHISSTGTQWDKIITYLSIILGFMIENSANNNHVHHSKIPEQVLIFIIQRIEQFSVEQNSSDRQEHIRVTARSDREPTVRRLILNLRQINIQSHSTN